MDNKISIIIPVYDSEFLAIRSVKSVINQTYKNWEIILINVSSCNSINILRQIIKGDNRIKIHEAIGVELNVAINCAIEEATGEYIAFLNYGDIFKLSKLEEELKYMQDKGYNFCHTAYERVDSRGSYIETIFLEELYENDGGGMIKQWTIESSTIIIKKEIIEKYRFVKENMVVYDTELWITIAENESLGYLEKPLSQLMFDNEEKLDKDKNVNNSKEQVANTLGEQGDNVYRG